VARWSGTKAGVAIAVAVTVFATGAAVGHLTLPGNAPDQLAQASTITEFAVTTESFDDARTVQVRFDSTGNTEVTPETAGRVTSTSCVTGGSFTSGTVAAAIDGVELLALSTTTPLWRSLTVGDTGDDVEALRTELVRLGVDVASTGAVDAELINAFTSLLGSNSANATTIPLERILWLPSSEAHIVSCDAPLGATVDTGTPLATVAGLINGIQVLDFPTDLVPGEHVLEVAGITAPVNESGAVTDAAALEAAGQSSQWLSASTAENPADAAISGVVALTVPVSVAAVAPAAVFAVDGTSACIATADTDIAVTVIGSRLGKTYVEPAAGGELPATVTAPSDPRRDCNPQ